MKRILHVALILILFTGCKTEQEKSPKALPYFGNYDIVFSETNGVQSIDTIFPKIPAFSYLNQDSVMITSKSMKGKVWIANFPKTDQPHVLRTYIKNNGIQASNWYFFTGDEAKTHRLGVMHFMVHADKDPMAAGGFAHSDGMVLVDREGYVRGVYRGTQTQEVDKLNKDLRKLLEIEYGINSKH